jgi:hypothetical protein
MNQQLRRRERINSTDTPRRWSMAREKLSAAKLYALLDREFKKVRSRECDDCRMPLPFYNAPADEYTANWHIGTPFHCPSGCHLAIAEVLARMWTRYDLDVPVERRLVIRKERKFDRPVQPVRTERRRKLRATYRAP